MVATGDGRSRAKQRPLRGGLGIDIAPIALRGVDRRLVQVAAMLKAQHPIAYADAFAAATAKALRSPVVTGDPEFRRLENDVDIIWTTET